MRNTQLVGWLGTYCITSQDFFEVWDTIRGSDPRLIVDVSLAVLVLQGWLARPTPNRFLWLGLGQGRQSLAVRPELLFVLVVDYVFRQINGHGIRIAGKLLQDVDFADDVGLIEADKQKLQEFLNKLAEKAEYFGLHINAPKTKAMSISSSPMGIQLGGEDIEQVTDFKYLGSTVTSSGDSEKELCTRISFQRLLPV
ncbi:uncharacterized protein LOC136025795 [Artemia franciscana]|uniref:uncharacterized protein LOC136025795 n=1 Tax=Artemia franciscana TaxID=6661 RepID=UPI0032DA5C3E